MTKRIFRSICAAAIGVFLASLALMTGLFYDYYSGIQMAQLRAQAALVAQGVALDAGSYFSGLDTHGFRITWIAADGSVLYDSDADALGMENHLAREEVQQALADGSGESARYSTTLTTRSIYCAQRLADGTVIRLSCEQYTVPTLLMGMLQPIILAAIAAVAVSFALAYRLSRSIVKPLNELDPDAPRRSPPYEELAPLIDRISGQQYLLKSQSSALQRQKDEFEAATGGMNEGLILLGEQGEVLSINRAAARLLGVSRFSVGKSMLELNGSEELKNLLLHAQQGQPGETELSIAGREYQINASPVVSDGAVSGVALLIFDVTEKEKAAQMRREFTANVSHELKTPLHTISGCAELLAGGLVKPEDIPEFAQRIYTESRRMTTLVEDIIRLSRLDEGAGDMQSESVDLYELAQAAVRSLEPAARGAGVTLTLRGESAPMTGIRQLLSGIIFNLCDNAIKYNREGGSVEVCVENAADSVLLRVEDSGIGIPPEQQERIFERFYRVDKSRSKAVGGTGLGLSIVKHAAKLHNADIELHSVPDEGTRITVTFPREMEGH